jgi:hypothetical protein
LHGTQKQGLCVSTVPGTIVQSFAENVLRRGRRKRIGVSIDFIEIIITALHEKQTLHQQQRA